MNDTNKNKKNDDKNNINIYNNNNTEIINDNRNPNNSIKPICKYYLSLFNFLAILNMTCRYKMNCL